MAGKSPRGFSSESVSCASTRVWKEQSGMRSALLGTKTRTRYSDQRFSETVVDQNTEKKMAKFRVVGNPVMSGAEKLTLQVIGATATPEADELPQFLDPVCIDWSMSEFCFIAHVSPWDESAPRLNHIPFERFQEECDSGDWQRLDTEHAFQWEYPFPLLAVIATDRHRLPQQTLNALQSELPRPHEASSKLFDQVRRLNWTTLLEKIRADPAATPYLEIGEA